MKTDAPLARITVGGSISSAAAHTITGGQLTIGRSSDNDLVLADALVSRRHARIRHAETRWTIEDLGSRHGTLLEGRPLSGEAPLANGARICIGATELRFDLVRARDDSTHSRTPEQRGDRPVLIGRSAAITVVRDLIARVAPSESPVLLLGESGTGKEVVARMLHHLSPRVANPFVIVNCPALPPNLVEAELFGIEKNVATGVSARRGKLEEADGGTLFLDELGDLDLGAQARLLRFLQDKMVERVGGRRSIAVDARVVAATHHDVAADVTAGRFRLDLYYRLNTVVLVIPPLRDRLEDVPLLVEHFLFTRTRGRKIASAAALDVLRGHAFPGNVRELEAVVARAALLSDGPVIGPEAISFAPLGAAVTGPIAILPTDQEMALALLRRIEAGESFWEVVHSPFLRRSLAASTVRELVDVALGAAGDSYRRMADRLGVTDRKQYKRFIDFLRNHALRPRRAGTE